MKSPVYLSRNQLVADFLDDLPILDSRVIKLPTVPVISLRSYLPSAAFHGARVSLISGGGSGHEPAHAGFVCQGMLSAAVVGDVFTSPSVTAVFEAIKSVSGNSGCLLIVKNYTGDRLNFGLAAEKARSIGIPVRIVIVGDDVALIPDHHNDDDSDTIISPRGLAGVVFVHKIAGYAAERGESLDRVHSIATAVAESVHTYGVAFSMCDLPKSNHSAESLVSTGECELGLGIHGEAGRLRIPTPPLEELVETMLTKIMSTVPHEQSAHPDRRHSVCVLLNNLGTMTTLELQIIAGTIVRKFCTLYPGVRIERLFTGTFVSSLNMRGFSITVLDLGSNSSSSVSVNDNSNDNEVNIQDRRSFWLRALDHSVDSTAWPSSSSIPLPSHEWEGHSSSAVQQVTPNSPSQTIAEEDDSIDSGFRVQVWKGHLSEICERILTMEAEMNDWDSLIGDGDMGTSMSRCARGILNRLVSSSPMSISSLWRLISQVFESDAGGSSGPLLSAFFLRLSVESKRTSRREKPFLPTENQPTTTTTTTDDRSSDESMVSDWAVWFPSALAALCDLGQTCVGDSTLVDALWPISQVLIQSTATTTATTDGTTGNDETLTGTNAGVISFSMRTQREERQRQQLSSSSSTTSSVGAQFEASITKPLSAVAVLDLCLRAAIFGSDWTRSLVARRGRAAYVGQRKLGIADAGSRAVVFVLEKLFQLVSSQHQSVAQ